MTQTTLYSYQTVEEARAALRDSGISAHTLDGYGETHMAEWMWRHDAAPEEAAVAFGAQPLARD